MTETRPPAAILAVDGGNSKVDLVLAAADGTVLACLRGPTVSHQQIPLEEGLERLESLIDRALAEAGLAVGVRPAAAYGVFCLAGADSPTDERMLDSALAARHLTAHGMLRNDAFAALRAGTDRTWGVAIIGGAGINAVGVAPNGDVARFAALGRISGDKGGGEEVGWQGLAAAARARDGRGGPTTLERLVPEYFGLATPEDVTNAFYADLLAEDAVRGLAPIVLGAAHAGDAEAQAIVASMADEVIAFAAGAIRRLDLSSTDVVVTLAGSIMRNAGPAFQSRVESGVRSIAPAATVVTLDALPVTGAALLALDQLEIVDRPAAETRLRGGIAASSIASGGAAAGAVTGAGPAERILPPGT